MDINLLAKIVGDLVLDHDEVGLPGLGTFVAEMVPASFSDKGFTINPPYRRLSFHQGRSEDNLLADSYAASNSITREQAVAILTPFFEELKSELKAKKAVALPGLGRLRATRENNFFFVSDEDLDIFPDGFALRPVSLKSHAETPEETRKAVDALAAELLAPEPATEAEAPQEQPESVEQIVPEPQETVMPDVTEQEIAEPETAEPETAAPEIAEQESLERESAPVVIGPEPAPEPVEQEPAPDSLRPEPTTSDVPAEPVSVSSAELPEKRGSRRSRVLLWVAIYLVLLALAFFAIFMILVPLAPEFVDKLLYTSEQLEIINM